MLRVAISMLVLLLAGCGSHPPVPVVDASPAVVVEKGRAVASAPAVAREGYYIVKKGDTLYRVAKTYGVSTHDLVTWNSLSDETRIEVGQELRVVPPEGGDIVEVRPIVAAAPITVVGDNNGASPQVTTTTVASTGSSSVVAGGVVRDPKGGKIAYSDTALAEVRAFDSTLPPLKPVSVPAAAPGVPAAASAAPAVSPAAAPASQPATPAAAGGIDWTWPVAGKVIRGFGKNGAGEISRGIDIAGRKGEPVQVAAEGKVSYVGNLKEYGDFVVVRHNPDYLSVYANTSKILVKEGQAVTRGQKIAEVGASGTDKPKLHFEIRHLSQPVDPIKLLPERQ